MEKTIAELFYRISAIVIVLSVWPVLDRYQGNQTQALKKHQALKWWSEKKKTHWKQHENAIYFHSQQLLTATAVAVIVRITVFSFVVQQLLFYLLALTMTIIIIFENENTKTSERNLWLKMKHNTIFNGKHNWSDDYIVPPMYSKRRLASFKTEILFLKMISTDVAPYNRQLLLLEKHKNISVQTHLPQYNEKSSLQFVIIG